MKFKKIITGVIFLFSIVMIVTSIGITSIDLSKGKNLIMLNITEPFYVETLIKLNPSIEVVSYIENNESIGYVNVYGGIGKNFIMREGTEYEIIVSDNAGLVLPYESLEG